MKRLSDLIVSAMAILLLAPAMAAIALAVRLGSPGPVLYLGERVGRLGRPFRIMKFRTMVVGADQIGPSSTAGDDTRITRVGTLLRQWKLDELPQLFNVFLGDMSLVGPRPQVQWAVDLYRGEELELLDLRPGITDYASLYFRDEGELLRGHSNPDRAYLRIIAPLKTRLSLSYVRGHNAWVDAKLIAATLLALVGIDPQWCFDDVQRELVASHRTNRALNVAA